jgi:hypothetical protein
VNPEAERLEEETLLREEEVRAEEHWEALRKSLRQNSPSVAGAYAANSALG